MFHVVDCDLKNLNVGYTPLLYACRNIGNAGALPITWALLHAGASSSRYLRKSAITLSHQFKGKSLIIIQEARRQQQLVIGQILQKFIFLGRSEWSFIFGKNILNFIVRFNWPAT